MATNTHASEAEEEVYPQHSPILTERCIAVASRLSQSQVPVELLVDKDLASRLIAAVNIESDTWNGDGLDGHENPDLFHLADVDRLVFSLSVDDKRNVITKEILARRWGIGLDTAHKTLKCTTQRGIRTFLHPTDRRVSTRKPHLVFPTMRGKKLYTDTMFAKIRSLRSNTCAQVWTDGLGYSLFYPLKSKREAPTTVWKMVHDLQAIPEVIVSDVRESRLESSGRTRSI
jgi:hypothetical protein